MVICFELEAEFGVFGEIWVEQWSPWHRAAVVGDDLGEGLEAAIVHVGGGEGEVPEAGGGEALIAEAIVVELVV